MAKSIENGDSANTMLITLSNHTGTHVDAPRHFCPGGKTTREILGESFKLSKVYCFDIAAGQDSAVGISGIKPIMEKIPDAEGLLIRTGMYRLRKNDPGRYCLNHPWIHPEVPAFLKTAYPLLRLFGTDTISISNPQFRTEGRECHRAFLCGDNPIILAEDLDLSDPDLVSGQLTVMIYPWIVEDLDGIPVHVFAELPP
jgi:kynurenine formamidase